MSDQPSSDSRSSRRSPLGFDELIAIVIAFAAIAAVLFWGISRKGDPRSGNWLAGVLPTTEGDKSAAPPASGSIIPDVLPGLETSPTANARLQEADRSPAQSLNNAPDSTPDLPQEVPAENSAVVAPIGAAAIVAAPQSTTPQIAVPAPSSGAAATFPDVPSDYWALPFISSLTQRGIISGFPDGTFQPDQPVSRAQYAAMLEKVLSQDAQQPIAFRDLPENFWATPAIDAAVKGGFLKGYPGEIFQPDQPITRLQVLVSLVNGVGLPASSAPTEALKVYQDSGQIPEWATPAIASATESDVVVNYPDRDRLNSDKPATRAEVAASLYQALATTGQLPPIQSNYIVRP